MIRLWLACGSTAVAMTLASCGSSDNGKNRPGRPPASKAVLTNPTPSAAADPTQPGNEAGSLTAPVLPLAQALARIESSSLGDLVVPASSYISPTDTTAVGAALWSKLKAAVAADSTRKSEYEAHEMVYDKVKMRFTFNQIGEKPEGGYPLYIALHGGGSTAASTNDGQWNAMSGYYRGSVKQGIYIAPRGVIDSYNMHSVDPACILYDRLIENAVALNDVNPNRVYILGFSAGGDGVYQLLPRMADRWAGGNMSAGHPNGINQDNLRNTAMLLQMGENDTAYNRHQEVVKFYEGLINKRSELGGGFDADIFLHFGGTHNSWRDNEPKLTAQEVLADPIAWLKSGQRTTKKVDTNAVAWLDKRTRNPYPKELVWNLETRAGRNLIASAAYAEGKGSLTAPHELFYWTDARCNSELKGRLRVTFNADDNSFQILESGSLKRLRLLLNAAMVDFGKPIAVKVGDKPIASVNPQPDLAIMTRSLLERGDPSYLFHSEINLVSDATGQWQILTSAQGDTCPAPSP